MRCTGVASVIFNEIYGSYYNVVAAVLAEAVSGSVSPERIREIVREKAFLESGTAIPGALRSGKWPLVAGDGSTPVTRVPTMPLTELEKRWMKAVCQDPRIRLFDPPVKDLDGTEPLFEEDFFVFFDRYADGDPFGDPEYREHFRTVLTALREGFGLKIRYAGKRGRHTQTFVPDRLEYSPKDDKFRLLAHSAWGTPYAVNLARILHAELTEPIPDAKEARPERKRSVTLILTDTRNTLERAMIHFSDLEKETVRLDDLHYRVTLRYRKDDETEILVRILAFGPTVRVTGPDGFLRLVRERLDMQKGCGS